MFFPAWRRNVLGAATVEHNFSLTVDGPQKFGNVQIQALQFDLNIFCIEREKTRCTPIILVFLLKQEFKGFHSPLSCKNVFL